MLPPSSLQPTDLILHATEACIASLNSLAELQQLLYMLGIYPDWWCCLCKCQSGLHRNQPGLSHQAALLHLQYG